MHLRACCLALLAAPLLLATPPPASWLIDHASPQPAPGTLVVTTLADLGVTPTDDLAGVRVTTAAGRELPAQLDRFGAAPELIDVVVRLDLQPWAREVLTCTWTATPAAAPPALQATLTASGALLITPLGSYPLGRYGQQGLRVEQPRLASLVAAESDRAVEALLTETADPSADAIAATLPAAMRPGGLPLCLLGVDGFSAGAALVTAAGPLRVAASLVDADATWSLGGDKVRVTARQTFWLGADEIAPALDFHLTTHDPVKRGRLLIGGLQLNTVDRRWQAHFGLGRQPPFGARTVKPLTGSGKPPYLEGYQRAAWDNRWSRADAERQPHLSVATAIDRLASRLGTELQWDSGRLELDSRLLLEDPGPGAASLGHQLDFRDLPAGHRGYVRCRFALRTDGQPAWAAEQQDAWQATTSPRAVAATPHPVPAAADLAPLLAGRQVVLVTPDALARPGVPPPAAWDALAARLGAPRVTAAALLPLHNSLRPQSLPPELTAVLVGWPGSSHLFDQLNQQHGVLAPLPADAPRTTLAVLPGDAARGPVVLVAANRPDAVALALEQLAALLPPPPARPPLVVMPQTWAETMPAPWSARGTPPAPTPVLAWPGGHAEFLFLLEAHQPLAELPVTPPTTPGAELRWVAWRFDSPQGPRVRPVHDAALETPPASLAPGQLMGLWVSLPLPAAAAPGPHQDALTIAGVTVPLAWEVLPVPLGERPFGFYAMGFSRDMLRQYYRWDDETAFQHLPALVRQARALGVDGYVYDIQGITLALDGAGKVVVDIGGLQRELAAVAAGGGMRYEEISSLTHLYHTYRPLFIKVSGARSREEEETAWDAIAPAIRTALADAGLEGRLICRHGDEIGDYAEWLARARRYRAAGVRLTVAINGYGVEHKQEAIGAMDHWIPLYNFFLNRWGKPIADDEPTMFSRQFRDARRAAGETIWPYVCGPGPYAWSPRPRSQVRWLVTDTYLKGADGLSYYGGMVWSHALDPAFRQQELAPLFTADCTFSALYYPDPTGAPRLWPSLRAVAVRQGLEDVAAIAALRRLAAARGRTEAGETPLAAAFAKVGDASPQAAFDDFRRDLATLAQQLAQP